MGVPAVEALTGGLPRGSLIEICGERCSGRTSLTLKMLATAIARGEVCALVDASDAFDPESADAVGVDFERLLWVRCARFDQAFRAAEWLLLGGGIGLLVLDLSDIAPTQLQYVPLNVWFRLRRAVEHTPTMLVILEQRPFAGSSASLTLKVRTESSAWLRTQSGQGPAHTNLFSEKCVSAELVRRRDGQASGDGSLNRRERLSTPRCRVRLRCLKPLCCSGGVSRVSPPTVVEATQAATRACPERSAGTSPLEQRCHRDPFDGGSRPAPFQRAKTPAASPILFQAPSGEGFHSSA